MTNADTPKPEAKPAPGPGRLLREARERMNLGQHAVADALHLRLAVVDALENDRYDQLPPATFTKGYLKVYAKLVHVSEDEVLVAYERQVEGLTGGEDRAEAASRRGSASRRRALLIAVPLVLLIAVVIWGAVEHFTDTGDAVSTPTAAEESATEEAADPAPAPEPEPDTAENSARDTEVEPQLPDPRVEEPEPSFAAVASEPVERAVEPAVSAPAAPLALRLAADSWIEVRDAYGNNLLTGTLSGPETYEISAPAPYRLVIGHAAVVEVLHHGEPVDLTPYTRGRVARFTLGAE